MASRPQRPWKALLLLLLPLLLLLLAPLSSRAGAYAQASGDAAEDEFATVEETGLVSEGSVVEDIGPAAGVETAVFWPKKPDSITAGESAEIIVGITNLGDDDLKVSFIQASLLPPYDHKYIIQNFTAQELQDAAVPHGVQASFPYSFTVSKFLQAGSFALVGHVYYYVGDQIHKHVFFNGTVDVTEASSVFSGESLFLSTLGLGLLGLFGMWVYGQVQKLSKKSRRPKKAETGTRTIPADGAINEWLEGTAFTANKATKAIASKLKSKKKK